MFLMWGDVGFDVSNYDLFIFYFGFNSFYVFNFQYCILLVSNQSLYVE